MTTEETTAPEVTAAPEATEPVVEQVAETTAPEEKSPTDDVDFASKFAALTRREKSILRKQKEAEEKYGKVVEYEKAMAEARKNPVKFLESVGLSYQQITDFLLHDGKPTVESQLEELRLQYEEDKKRREQEKIELEESRKKEQEELYQQAVENHKKQIQSFLDTNRDDYELCALNDASDDIFDVMEEYYNTNGVMLSIDKAAEAVEKYLEQEAEKLFQAKKLAAKRQIPEDGTKTVQPSTVSKTITNNIGEFAVADTKGLSDEESKAAAARLLRWT